MKLSIVIPARNEAPNLRLTVPEVRRALLAGGYEFEIIVVDDHSTDGTDRALSELAASCPELRRVVNEKPPGFGYAVRAGIQAVRGDAVAVYMADGSDTPEDLARFFQHMLAHDVDCVFGSRFMRGSRVVDYPLHKLVLNRLANLFIRVLFAIPYNDTTNAFKLYKKSTLDNLVPFLSCHFNFTVELPLKAIVRGHSYAILPNAWINRKHGVSKLQIREMGSRYLFIIIYCFIERWLSRGDYRKLPEIEPKSPKSRRSVKSAA